MSRPIVEDSIVVVAKVEVPVNDERPETARVPAVTEAKVVVANVLVPVKNESPFTVILPADVEARVVVPVNVGAAERTKLPVPVTPVTSVRRVSSWEMVVKAAERPRELVAT